MTIERDGTFAELDDSQWQAMLETLAGDGPELAELLMELGRLARKQGRTKVALHHFNSAVYQEEARGRGQSPVAMEALRALSELSMRLEEPTMAARWASKMLQQAPDDKSRRLAKRLIEKATPAQDEVQQRQHPNARQMVGGHDLFVPEPLKVDIALADVGGLAAAKSVVNTYGIMPIKDPKSAEYYGISGGGGLLLVGPPGCGKTLLGQAAAGEMGVPFFAVRGSDLLHPLYGMAERNVVSAFETARANRPCVLFFDELDNIAPSRMSSPQAMYRSLANTILAEMDGGKDNSGILIIGATNAPELVDDAVKRPGRFDRIVYVGIPDSVARRAIWEIGLSRKRPWAEDIDVAQLVELSEGLSGAAIAGAMRDAAESVWVASYEDGVRRDIRMLDLLVALRRACVEGRIRNRIDEAIVALWGEELEGGEG